MRERRYKYTVWEGPLRQAQGPGFSCGTVSELASGEPAEPVELADISCARVKETAWVINAKLNKRGQVSFSALNIFYSWFRLIAEKET